MDECHDWYNEWYKAENSEQHFPNEELCRFLYRCFPNDRNKSNIKILEVGCGQGANLLYLSSEGFDTFGIDLSEECISRVPVLFERYHQDLPGVSCQNMLNTNFDDNSFDVVVDVFSSHCLSEKQYEIFLVELGRILKNGGLFFSFTPSKASDAFTRYKPSSLLDSSTLNGIIRSDSPFSGNMYPFRFMAPDDAERLMECNGLKVEYMETLSRSYFGRRESFEFLLLQAEMKK